METIANSKLRPGATAELLDVRGVAALLNCSPRHVYRLADAGRMPRPIKLGSLVRWVWRGGPDGIEEWIAAGCPPVCAALEMRHPKKVDVVLGAIHVIAHGTVAASHARHAQHPIDWAAVIACLLLAVLIVFRYPLKRVSNKLSHGTHPR